MKSTFKVLFYLKKNEPKKNGRVSITDKRGLSAIFFADLITMDLSIG